MSDEEDVNHSQASFSGAGIVSAAETIASGIGGLMHGYVSSEDPDWEAGGYESDEPMSVLYMAATGGYKRSDSMRTNAYQVEYWQCISNVTNLQHNGDTALVSERL